MTHVGEAHSVGAAPAASGLGSILFPPRGGSLAVPQQAEQPDWFADLHLDQIVDALDAGRAEYELRRWWYTLSPGVGTVVYRQQVWRDLDREPVGTIVNAFAEDLRRMRGALARAEQSRYAGPRRAFTLHAIGSYCGAVAALSSNLADVEVESDALCAVRDRLADYVATAAFRGLARSSEDLAGRLSQVRYCVHVKNAKVTVTRYDDEPDYTEQVERTFARFAGTGHRVSLVRPGSGSSMSHVDARIEELVERLYPDLFADLGAFCAAHTDFADPGIVRLDRELQFYLAYRDLIAPMTVQGLPFCLPDVRVDQPRIEVRGGFDLALALKASTRDRPVVCNDVTLSGAERMIVVSGPNQGGKTTFARACGQLHHLAALGYPVPGRSAQVILPDRIFTHFEHAEDPANLRGKLEDELVGYRAIVEAATPASVVILNEAFSGTTLDDARFVGERILAALTERGVLGVCVTFVDELSTLNDATVSMTSMIADHNPADRTFKVIRRPADGLAFAAALAERYRLTRAAIMERLA